MKPYTTTLSKLRAANACSRGYNLIAQHIGLTGDERHPGNTDWLPGDNPADIPLEMILDNNGLDDCLWALRATDGGTELAVAFSIYCAEPYYTEPTWVRWATKWMDGTDRSKDAAATAAAAAAPAAAAAATAADAAAGVAWAAARAARAAAQWAADAAAQWAADAARAAAWAAAARAAARAAERARQTEILRKLVRGL